MSAHWVVGFCVVWCGKIYIYMNIQVGMSTELNVLHITYHHYMRVPK